MRRNDRETEIRMMTMEEYLKKRQAIRRRGNMGENECHEKTAAALKLVELLYNWWINHRSAHSYFLKAGWSE